MLDDAVKVLSSKSKIRSMKSIKLVLLAVAAVGCVSLTSCGSNAASEPPVYVAPTK
ncbi:hypothetical protein [Rubritalea tangerina]|uniref:hypothetical protein n=1 Tax=Rubritalea tangerina TaxID=430798 RepID=UPI0036183C6D